MVTASTAALLDIEPDLSRFLSPQQLSEAGPVQVPVQSVPKGDVDVGALLREHGAFGAVVLDGMLLHLVRLGDQVAVRLLGPGDVVLPTGVSAPMLLDGSGWRATVATELAVLGNEVLVAAHRWPRIVAALHLRVSEQAERIVTQLAICQLPRVDQRLLALMWLLAESWGQVTPSGTTLPLALTHDALGRLVGARRPTVTLALGELTERGAIVRQDRGWLLLERPPPPSGGIPKLEEPEPLNGVGSTWLNGAEIVQELTVEERAELRETMMRLRSEHQQHREMVRRQLKELADSRARTREIRWQITQQSIRRRPAPS